MIAETCREKDCALRIVDPTQLREVHYGYEVQSFSYKTWKDVKINLAGSYQIQNAALALEAVEALRGVGYRLSDEQVRAGMLHTVWRGRFTLLRRDPVVIIDGAHNPGAAQELQESLKRCFPNKKLHYIMGMFRDKDFQTVIQLTAPLAEDIITVETPNNPRALSAQALKKAVEAVNPRTQAAESIAQAVKLSLERADHEDVIVIFGSLSFLGEAEQAVLTGGTGNEP